MLSENYRAVNKNGGIHLYYDAPCGSAEVHVATIHIEDGYAMMRHPFNGNYLPLSFNVMRQVLSLALQETD